MAVFHTLATIHSAGFFAVPIASQNFLHRLRMQQTQAGPWLADARALEVDILVSDRGKVITELCQSQVRPTVCHGTDLPLKVVRF